MSICVYEAISIFDFRCIPPSSHFVFIIFFVLCVLQFQWFFTILPYWCVLLMCVWVELSKASASRLEQRIHRLSCRSVQ